MSELRVATRYAKSLIDLAEKEGKLNAIVSDMRSLLSVVKENRQLEIALSNPIISNKKKIAILLSIFDGKVDDLSLSFLRLVSNKNRENILPLIAKEVLRMNQAIRGEINGEITTPISLTDDLRSTFMTLINEKFGKKVNLKEKIDPSLIGGYILRVGDTQLDESLRTKLQRLSLNITDNTYKSKY